MIDNEFYTQTLHGPYQTQNIGDLPLEDGGTLSNCHLAYATFGKLSAAKDNAILVTTWFSGTSKIMEQAYIGPGRALDPGRYFIIVINQIGNGLSSSPHNVPDAAGGPDFPRIRISDDVNAQHSLLTKYFGIDKLQLVMGASMGAEQTYEWAVRYPEMVCRAAPIAGTARTTAHTSLFAQTLRDAITSDPGWQDGRYKSASSVSDGLRRHARLWAVMGASPAMYAAEAWRTLGFSSLNDFVTGLLDASFLPQDPNALLSQVWKWQQADVSRGYDRDLGKALRRITAKTIVMPIDPDMFFTVPDCAAEQGLIPGSELRILSSRWGHLGVMGMDQALLQQIDAGLSSVLSVEG